MAGLAIAGAVLGITGSLLNAYSQVSQYKEQKVTSKYNKAILDANERIDQSMIDMDIRRIREEGEGILGEQRAAMAKSGTTFSGSNIDVFMDSVRNIELDVISLELNKMISQAGTTQKKGLIDLGLAQSKASLPLKIAGSLLGAGNSILSANSSSIAASGAK